MGVEDTSRRRAGVDFQVGYSPGPAAKADSDRLTDGRAYMENNPFSQTSNAQDSLATRRRSTRIDYVTTVLLSGKDAAGTPFREFTQTATVNLHGCKVRTSYRIMVGMLVTLECPKAGTSGKGVCVRVWDPAPGVAGHEIAVQLIKPQNLWAVPNPPPDWEIVAKSMVQGRVVQTERTGQFSALSSTSAIAPNTVPGRVVQTGRTGQFPAPSSTSAIAPNTVPGRVVQTGRTGQFPSLAGPNAPASNATAPSMVLGRLVQSERTGQFPALSTTSTALPVAAPRVPAPAPATVPRPPAPVAAPRAAAIPQPVEPARPAPVAGPTIEQRLADLEKRSTQLVESVLDIMRGQAEELTRNSLEEFRQQVDALLQDAEGRLRQGFQQAYEESAASLIGLRSDLMEQMSSRGAQMIRSSEDTLRTRLRGQMPFEETTAPAKPPEKVTGK